MNSRTLAMRTRQRGFSLVELMVALTLSLVLLAGALSILYSSKLSYAENERVARLQEAGRTVIEMILRDTRSAGYMGCSRPINGTEFSNGLIGSADLLWNFAQPAFGYEAGIVDDESGWTPALDADIELATPGSDVLVIRTSRQGQPVFRTNTAVIAPASDPIQVDREPNATLPAGTPMIITDCEGAAIFVSTGYTEEPDGPDGEPRASIGHALGAGGGENNADSLARGFLANALVMPVQTIVYYVRPSENPGNAGSPSLWQKVGRNEPQELVEGVENLQVLYGIDDDSNLLADRYVAADTVNTDNAWDRVISVQVAILVSSPVEGGVETDSRSFNLLGTIVEPANDRRQRTVFTTTVMLRNRTT